MADNKISLDKLKKEMNDTVINYLRESETSGNTPTEEQFRELGSRLVNNIGIEHRKELSHEDLNILKNTMTNYFETAMVPKYKRSLREHPREVNGHWPTSVSDEAYKSYSKTLKEEKEALIKDIKYLIRESERTNRTPTQAQAISWLSERMQKDLANWGDEQGKRYVTSYVNAWLSGEYAKRMSQSQRNRPRKENGHWPWKTDEEEQQEKAKDILAGTQGNGPLKDFHSRAPFASNYMKTYQSFSGYDMVCTIEMHMPKGGTYTQVIGELQTITYSIHQEKSPIRCLGDMNAKGYVFGPRTIAGTLIFTVFDRHWTTKMEKDYLADAGVKAHMLADEFPPFNLTISCANEYGHDAVCSIFGITLVNEGQVMSINDVFTENTYQFYATDVQYLAPVDVTMGGTKNTTKDLPTVNTKATPSPEKPVPPEKQKPLPQVEEKKPDPDPEKPKENQTQPTEPPKQEDDQPAQASPTPTPEPTPAPEPTPSPSPAPAPTPAPQQASQKPVLTDEEYEEKLKKLNDTYEQRKAQIHETAQKNPYGGQAQERILMQRLNDQYAAAKAALDRAHERSKEA